MMSERDLKDAGIPHNLAAHEAGKWPWQSWNPQWRELEASRGREPSASEHW